MNLIVTESYAESCLYAAHQIAALIQQTPTAKLGLATGGTPVPIYRELARLCRAGEVSFAKVRTVNLDEYCGLTGQNDQSYRHFMEKHLFSKIDIDTANTYVACGVGDEQTNCRALDEAVLAGGVPDLQLLGVGTNGHIGFNEASETLTAHAHIEQLSATTIAANARFFAGSDEVPTRAITMGMQNILCARRILLVATGKAKAEAIRGLIQNDDVTTRNPCTFLKLHPFADVVIDRTLAAAAGWPDA